MSDTTKFILIPADNSSVLGYINEFMEATKLGLATNFGFDEFDTKNNFQHKPQIILLIDKSIQLEDGEQCLAYEQKKIVNHVCLKNMGIGQGAFYKILCSSDKKLTPNAFISESDLQEIVDCYNKNYEFPQWELEYSTSYDYAEIPPHSEIVCRKPFTNFANEVVFKKPEQHPVNVTGQDINGNYPVEHKSKEWTEDKVIDFVNWYIALNKLSTKYELENRTIIESFENGDDYKKWWTAKEPQEKLPTDEAIKLESEKRFTNHLTDYNDVEKSKSFIKGAKWVRDNYDKPNKVEHEMHLNMQYYMEYCNMKGYVTPQEWLEKHKHF